MPRVIYEAVIPDPTPVELPDGWELVGGSTAEERNEHARQLAADFGVLAVRSLGHNIEIGIPETASIIGPNDFELTLGTELQHVITQGGLHRLRRDFQALTAGIMADPFGATCIDAFKDTDAGQWARLVHRVEGPLSNLVPGKQLAVKGTGLDMERTRRDLERGGPRRVDLTDQFRSTLLLSRTQKERAPNGVGNRITVNEVYGVVRWREADGRLQEWMLMEYVEGGKPVANVGKERVLSRGGTILVPGFERADHPELAAIADGPYRPYGWQSELIPFSDLSDNIASELGLLAYDCPLTDLTGNNLLRQETANGPRYTIIDVQSHRN